MKAGILVFPASNCDRDVLTCLHKITGEKPSLIWHTETDLPKLDLMIIPGGFSYGDYLRCGAIASKSPIMRQVIEKAKKGVAVMGICNGFQILTESGLLPGSLTYNQNLRFICRQTHLVVKRTKAPFTHHYKLGETIILPVAHMQGNYFADEDTLKCLEDDNRIAFTYQNDDNPNGSLLNIAGIVNKAGNVLGLMPHPERASEPLLGGNDGVKLFHSLLDAFQ